MGVAWGPVIKNRWVLVYHPPFSFFSLIKNFSSVFQTTAEAYELSKLVLAQTDSMKAIQSFRDYSMLEKKNCRVYVDKIFLT